MKFPELLAFLNAPKIFLHKPILSITRTRMRTFYISVTLTKLDKTKYPEGKMRFAANGVEYEPLFDDIVARIMEFLEIK